MELAVNGGTPVRSKPLPAKYPGGSLIGREEMEEAAKVIAAKSLFRFYGDDVQHMVDQFEERMAQDLNVPYVLGVTSCTAALVTAMKALGIGYGDKVIVPAVTFIATPGAVIAAGAVPVFADVDESLNLDPDRLEDLIDQDVKAIIPVSVLGTPCEMDRIMAVARKHGLHVIEDVAQSCGVKYKGQYQGTIGDIGVFSFQQNKLLTAGEGGAVVTRDPVLFERAVRYHDQGLFRDGIRNRYGIADPAVPAFAGQNYRMSELTGAVLKAQWEKLDRIIATMRTHHGRIAGRLKRELPDLKFRKTVDEEGHLGSHLGLRMPTKEAARRFIRALSAENIECMLLYGGLPVYCNEQIFYQRTADKDNFPFNYPFEKPVQYTVGMCPGAEDLIQRTVLIPISPVLTERDDEDIAEGVIKVYRGLGIGEEADAEISDHRRA
jgi:8-amino-3,8-dideoxy-alpha-D-manno-octulosonate transaminase